MTNVNKIKGDRWERDVQDYAQAHGFPWAERTRAGYARDHGDIHLDPVTRAVILQAKNHAAMRLGEWLAGLADQVDAAGAQHGALVVKRRGVGDAGRSYAVMELSALLGLLRAAGYGSVPDEAVAARVGELSA